MSHNKPALCQLPKNLNPFPPCLSAPLQKNSGTVGINASTPSQNYPKSSPPQTAGLDGSLRWNPGFPLTPTKTALYYGWPRTLVRPTNRLQIPKLQQILGEGRGRGGGFPFPQKNHTVFFRSQVFFLETEWTITSLDLQENNTHCYNFRCFLNVFLKTNIFSGFYLGHYCFPCLTGG